MKLKTAIPLIMLLVFIDQISKFLIKNPIKNTGAAFGILQQYTLFLIIISVLVLFLCIYYFKKIRQYGIYGLILLFSGTLGNLIDRIYLGYVRDFIIIWIWPAFNLADLFSTIGVFILLVYFYKN